MSAHSRLPLTVALVNDHELIVRGIAAMLEPFNDLITVVELDPVRALTAHMDGHRVAPLADALPDASTSLSMTPSLAPASTPMTSTCCAPTRTLVEWSCSLGSSPRSSSHRRAREESPPPSPSRLMVPLWSKR